MEDNEQVHIESVEPEVSTRALVAGNVVAGTHYRDANNAYVSVSVDEGAAGKVEYAVSTPLVDAQGNTKSAAQIRTDLLAAVTAWRASQFPAKTTLAGFSGAVTV